VFVFAAKSIISASLPRSAIRRCWGIGRAEWEGWLSHIIHLFWQLGG